MTNAILEGKNVRKVISESSSFVTSLPSDPLDNLRGEAWLTALKKDYPESAKKVEKAFNKVMKAIKANKAIDFGSECIITIAGTSFMYDMDGDYDFIKGNIKTYILNMLQGLDFYVDNVTDYSEDWEVVSPEVLFKRYFEDFYDDERDENWQMFIDEVTSSSTITEQQITSYFKKGRYCFQPA